MRRAKRAVLVATGLLIGLYAAIAIGLALGQGPLIYPAPRGQGAMAGGFEAVGYRTEDGLDLAAGYRAAQQGKPTILYFHGNGTDWTSSIIATDRMVPEGYGVLAAEYRGYRGNPGSPSEQGLYRDGRAALRFLEREGVGPSQVVMIGNSVGTGVAAQLASETTPAALILISPFASLSQLVGEKMWWLPTGLLLRDRYDTLTTLERVEAPILLMHGDADTLIPHAHSEQLAAKKAGAELAIFPGIGHDLAWHPAAEDRALAFMERATGSGKSD